MSAAAQIEESTEQLAEKSKAGCLDSFEKLVRKYERPVYNYLVQLTRSAHDAEDIAQEAFVKAYRNLHRFDTRYRFSTWLFAIAKHTALSHFRRARPAESIETIQEEIAADAPEFTEESAIWQVARTLTPKLFEALWLHYAQDFSVKEIAQIMNSNTVNVKVLLHRGRRALKEKLNRRKYDQLLAQ